MNETWAGLVACWQSTRAEDPLFARVYRRIANDEARHAALAWRMDAWAAARLCNADRVAVRRMRTRAIERLSASLAVEPPRRLVRTAGIPSRARAQRLFRGLSGAITA